MNINPTPDIRIASRLSTADKHTHGLYVYIRKDGVVYEPSLLHILRAIRKSLFPELSSIEVWSMHLHTIDIAAQTLFNRCKLEYDKLNENS